MLGQTKIAWHVTCFILAVNAAMVTLAMLHVALYW